MILTYDEGFKRASNPEWFKSFFKRDEIATDEEVKKYIEALLNNFSSNRRKPLHIDAQVYECISDIVWAVRRKDFTVSGVISRILVEHIKENAGMIKKITGRDYKLLQP